MISSTEGIRKVINGENILRTRFRNSPRICVSVLRNQLSARRARTSARECLDRRLGNSTFNTTDATGDQWNRIFQVRLLAPSAANQRILPQSDWQGQSL
jgi:hypothetical protein